MDGLNYTGCREVSAAMELAVDVSQNCDDLGADQDLETPLESLRTRQCWRRLPG